MQYRDTPLFLLPAACLCVALLGVAACDEDTPTSYGAFEVGAIDGYVLAAGQGVAIPLGARALEGVDRGRMIGATTADSTGLYHLDLPTGLYRLEFDPNFGSIRISTDMRDTVRVSRTKKRYDLIRGRAEIEILMPAEFENRWFRLRTSGDPYDHESADAAVAGGRLAFVFPVLRPGRCDLSMTGWGIGGAVRLPGVDSLTIGTDHVVRASADFTTCYASISGHITGSWQQAHGGGMSVYAVATGNRVVNSADCGSDGSFTIRMLVPQDIRVRTSCNGVEQWIGGTSFETARFFAIQPGDRITGVDMSEGGIAVTLAGPGDLIMYDPEVVLREESGAEVAIYGISGNRFSICNLPTGRYYLGLENACNDQIWLSQWYDGAADVESATLIDVVAGELSRIEMDLIEGGRIAGQVSTAEGDRPSYANLRLLDAGGATSCPHSTIASGGVFAFGGLPDGTYYLGLSVPSHGQWWYPGTYVFAEASAITIEGLGAVTGLNWSLPAGAQKVLP
jgi:hypothetical protein